MKNETYIKNEIERLMVLPSGRGFTPDLVKEATEKTIKLIDKALEVGKIKTVNKDILDSAIYDVLSTYY